jgi:hypothetical protein
MATLLFEAVSWGQLGSVRRGGPTAVYSELLVQLEELTIGKEGAQLFKGALSVAQSRDLERALATPPEDQAGTRLSGIPELRPFLCPAGPVRQIAASVLGQECHPVRAILFDKSADQNWSLGWHQDRTIVVTQRIEVNGFGPWRYKERHGPRRTAV